MKKVIVVVLVAAFLLLAFYALTARKTGLRRVVEVSSCVEITSPGTYVLTGDLKSEGTCIKVLSSDVVVEGGGFSIEGGEYCVYVEGVRNVTISNLRAVGCGYGFYVKDSEDVKLVNLEARGCKKPGVSLVGVRGAVLRGIRSTGNAAGIVVVSCEEDLKNYLLAEPFEERAKETGDVSVYDSVLTGNEIDGFFLLNGAGVTLRNCTCSGNAGGIYLFNSEEVVVENCTATDNEYVGVMLDNCDRCMVRRSFMRGNTGAVRLDYSDYCVIEENLIVDNILDGVFIQRKSSNNVVRGNVVKGGTYGIRVIDGEGNKVEGNKVHETLECDICLGKGVTVTMANNEYDVMKEVSEKPGKGPEQPKPPEGGKLPEKKEKAKEGEKAEAGKVNLEEISLAKGLIDRFGSWGHKHDEYSYTPGYAWIKPHPGPFNRYFIEKVKGVYDFTTCDEGVRKALSFGAEVVATIWPYAGWDEEAYKDREGYGMATGDGPFATVLPPSRFKPYDMEAYKDFVRALVERYDGDGIDDMPGLERPIKYWEVLNEPEAQGKPDETGRIKCFFQGSGEEYYELLKATYEAIKEADPEAKVILGAPASLKDKGAVKWWEEFFAAGGGMYFDIAAVHSYGDEEGDFNVGEMKELMEKYGVEKPIWVTEVGPVHDLVEKYGPEIYIKGAVRAFASGAEVLFFDYEPTPHKPLALVMAHVLGDFEEVEEIGEGCYRFTVHGREVYVVWSPGQLPSWVEGEVMVVDVYGNYEVVPAGEVKIGKDPVYVIIPPLEKD